MKLHRCARLERSTAVHCHAYPRIGIQYVENMLNHCETLETSQSTCPQAKAKDIHVGNRCKVDPWYHSVQLNATNVLEPVGAKQKSEMSVCSKDTHGHPSYLPIIFFPKCTN
jgi:hypothetical protein